tara:strand:+ start:1829 stop:3667 length:1839 start_codon:yes stop_codon:yes gene_type:complete
VAALTKSDIHFNIFGNDKSKKAFNSFNKSTKQANDSLKTLRNTIIGAFSVREIVQAGNVMIGVRNRMQAFTGSVEETSKAMDHMKRIAIESRSDFDAVAMLFTRLSLATEHLGATQLDVAKATQMVANTFIIAGSHAQEANNSARQLAQGLASGTLRGDELRSVMENNTILTKMLAEGLNMTVGELREFGHAGKLTAEVVMPILIQGFEETNDLIKEMPMTLGQAGVALRNNFQFMIGDIEELTDGFSGTASIVSKLANNMDVLLIPAIALLGSVIFSTLKKIRLLALANPLMGFITGVSAALMAAYVFRDEISLIIQRMNARFLRFGAQLELVFIKAFDKVREKFISFNNFLAEKTRGIAEFLGMEVNLIEFVKTDTKEIENEIQGYTDTIEKKLKHGAKKLPSILDLLLGRDPNEKQEEGETGFGARSVLETFFADAEKGYKDFFTSIKTVQDEIQGVFKKSYDGITNLTMDFLKKGKASFKDYATSIVEELIRIAMQKLVIDKMFASFGKIFPNLNITGTDIPSGDGGGFTGFGSRSGGVDGKGGFPAILHPNETVIDHTKGQSMGATVNFNISTVDAAGFDQLLAQRKGLITAMINQAMNNQGKMGIV